MKYYILYIINLLILNSSLKIIMIYLVILIREISANKDNYLELLLVRDGKLGLIFSVEID